MKEGCIIKLCILDGGTYGVGETKICTSPEQMYLGVIKEDAGPELICTGA
ncbi:hypothetical protein Tco_0283609, partial [Tanacetum coccineum]